jgi:hypothetical protein
MGQFGIVDIDFAAIGGYQTDNHVKTGCFAGTIRAEQANDLAGLHLEGNIFNHRPRLVAFFEIVSREFGEWGVHSSAPRMARRMVCLWLRRRNHDTARNASVWLVLQAFLATRRICVTRPFDSVLFRRRLREAPRRYLHR